MTTPSDNAYYIAVTGSELKLGAAKSALKLFLACQLCDKLEYYAESLKNALAKLILPKIDPAESLA